MRSADSVIIGAGIVGLCTAWQMHRRGVKNILLVDKGAGVGAGSTGASSAICRHRYSALPMIRLAHAGIDAYRHWQSFTGLKNPRARFHNDRVLWLTGANDGWADREHARMADLEIRTAVLDNDELCAEFPSFNNCTRPVDLEDPASHRCAAAPARHLLELDGGYMDPVDTAADLVDACRGGGVDVRFNEQVAEIAGEGGRISAVVLASGERVSTETVINAAGPWCHNLYRAVGLEPPMPLLPVRIQVVHVPRNGELKGPIPVCVDMQNGIYFRTQNRGQQLLVSTVREEEEREAVDDPDDYLRVADEGFKRDKLHLLQHRLPALRLREIRDYCGLYTINEADVHPLVGPLGPDGYFVANGFSGHGFKAAPAIGAMLARLVTGHKLPGEDSQDDHWLLPGRAPIAVDTRSVLA